MDEPAARVEVEGLKTDESFKLNGRDQRALPLGGTQGLAHLSAMELLTRGHMPADVSAIIGSIDIFFGESDR